MYAMFAMRKKHLNTCHQTTALVSQNMAERLSEWNHIPHFAHYVDSIPIVYIGACLAMSSSLRSMWVVHVKSQLQLIVLATLFGFVLCPSARRLMSHFGLHLHDILWKGTL